MSDDMPTVDDYFDEVNKEMNQDKEQAGTNIVAIIGIVAVMFIAIVCILSCALVAYAFLQNAPW
jgi:hypothetical protein